LLEVVVAVLIYRETIPPADPRLGRHIHHDSRSRHYTFDTDGITPTSVQHTRRVPVLDQGQLGSCTGNAGIGALGTDPLYDTLTDEQRARLDEPAAVDLYSAATAIDGVRGQYPPTDTGSDGLAIAKVLKADGRIAGYQHTFSLDAALRALTVTPVIAGMNWYEQMFHPDPDGRVHPGGQLAGGHEIVADGLDVELERVWFTNSWGTSWGVDGRFWLSFADLGRLLGEQGDITVFVPRTAPPPTPAPPVPADTVLAAALAHDRAWLTAPHRGAAGRVAKACAAFLAATPTPGQ
jgi:hypothetical protein